MQKQIAAAYIRVSTDDQTEYSPDAQIRAIRDYCVKNGYFLDDEHIYIDEGISGKSAAKRPEFQHMIMTAKSKDKPFDAIIVHKFDRFARSREDSVVYKSLLRKEHGIKVLSVTESIEDDKFSVILEAMLEAMAEYYSLNLAEEVKKGMTEKALRGEPLSIAPYGYIMEDKKLVIYPEQAELIKSLYMRFADGAAMFTLARELNNAGYRTNRGNKFENRTIEYILRNPVYIGKIRWNPARKTKRTLADPDIMIVQGHHEPIIDMDTWDKVQKRISAQKIKFKKNSKSLSVASHWLIGLLRCPNCGTGFVRNGSVYLQCGAYAKGACNTSQLIRITKIQSAVLSCIQKDMRDGGVLNLASNSKMLSDTAIYDKQIKGLERRLERAKEAYSAGIDSLDEYKANKERLVFEIDQLKIEKENAIPPAEKNAEATREGLRNGFAVLINEKATLEEKKKVARTLIHNIYYNKSDDTLYIVYE